jgi:hypothetical protein
MLASQSQDLLEVKLGERAPQDFFLTAGTKVAAWSQENPLEKIF